MKRTFAAIAITLGLLGAAAGTATTASAATTHSAPASFYHGLCGLPPYPFPATA